MDAGPTESLTGKTRHVWHFHNEVAERLVPDRVREIDDERLHAFGLTDQDIRVCREYPSEG